MAVKGHTRVRRLVAAIATLALAVGGALVGAQIANAAPTAQSCAYATAGTGTYARTLCWLDMTNFNLAAASSAPGQDMQVTLSSGYKLSYTLRQSGRSVASSTLPTYSGAFLGNNGNYTGVAGRPSLYQPSSAVDISDSVVTMSNITVTDPNNNPVTAFSIVGADAEATDGLEGIT